VGAGKRQELHEIVGNALTLCVVTGVVLMIFIPLAGPVLTLMQTPADILPEAREYLIICAMGNIAIAIYNGLCALLRGMGDSTRPTMFVAVATVANIVLDYLFVGVFHWRAAGAALATVVGQLIACIYAAIYLYHVRDRLGFKLRLKSFFPRAVHILTMLKIGAPIALKNTLISISSIFVQAMINGFGAVSIAAVGICMKLQNLVNVVSQSAENAASSLVGQNIAAGKLGRVKLIIFDTLLIGSVYGAVLIILFTLFPTQIFSIFTNDPEVIALAPTYMVVCSLLVAGNVFMSPTMGAMNGVGDTMYTLVIGLADGIVARIGFSLVLGYALNMGAFGFFLGSGLAAYVSVICGGIYFFSGVWKRKAPREVVEG
jgi:putative MATE family efflux protein